MAQPPQYSADGRFYWDGTRWVPVQVALQQQAWVKRSVPCATNTGCLIVIGIVIALVIAGLLFGGR